MSDDAIADEKTRLRAGFRAARRALGPAERQAETSATVRELRRFLSAARERSEVGAVGALDVPQQLALASYAASGSELDLDELHRWWWTAGGRVWLPRMRDDHSLAWHALSGGEALRRGAHGIPEPDPQLVPEAPLPSPAVVLVPGLAFTDAGRRLGQGAGCYDRLLASTSIAGLTTVGIGFSCQRTAHLPAAPHDRGVEWLSLGGVLTHRAS